MRFPVALTTTLLFSACATGDGDGPTDSPGADHDPPDAQAPAPDSAGAPVDGGAAEASARDAPSCPSGKTPCASLCVDSKTDPKNCGACGHACAGAEACVDGACVLTCDAGLTGCGGACVKTSTDLSHCGSCSNACPGAAAAICTGGKCSATLDVRAWVDGVSDLILQGSTVHWHHLSYAAPGLLGGVNEPTYLNASPWTPSWPSAGENRDCNCDSQPSPAVPPLPTHDQTVVLRKVSGRGSISVLEEPSAATGYAFRVELDDPSSGADWYEFVLTYATQ